MKECWINVYTFSSGNVWYGGRSPNRVSCNSMAQTAIANGAKLLYRIHVRMK